LAAQPFKRAASTAPVPYANASSTPVPITYSAGMLLAIGITSTNLMMARNWYARELVGKPD
jgi:hypothetical protein